MKIYGCLGTVFLTLVLAFYSPDYAASSASETTMSLQARLESWDVETIWPDVRKALSAHPQDPELLEILACPLCKTSVTLTRDGKGLLCSRCLRLYPIVDDIPVMLVEEAVLVKKAGTAASRTKKKASGRKMKPAAKKRTGARTGKTLRGKPKSKSKPKPRAKTKTKAKPKPKSKPKSKARRKR